MNIADLVILGVLTISTLISLLRGLLKEALSLVTWGAGFWLALKFYPVVSAMFEERIANDVARKVVGFVIILIAVVVVGGLLSKLMADLVAKIGLGGTDRWLGMVFGGARGVLLVAMVLLVIGSTSFVRDSWWQESMLIPHFHGVVDWLAQLLPKGIESFLRHNLSALS